MIMNDLVQQSILLFAKKSDLELWGRRAIVSHEKALYLDELLKLNLSDLSQMTARMLLELMGRISLHSTTWCGPFRQMKVERVCPSNAHS
jgi:hypothetical protein